MDLNSLLQADSRLPGPQPAFYRDVSPQQWRALAEQVHARGGRLMSLWGQDRGGLAGMTIHAVLVVQEGLLWLCAALESRHYPALDDLFPNVGRMQRATYDMLGLCADGARDERPWWRHAGWTERFPLRQSALPEESEPEELYPFVTVAGPGVHEIPVGPVHAGIIEPGHFRFSVVGERILRLDTHLGYTHKGIEKLAQHRDPQALIRLGGRLSGDSTVAGSWATALALEAILGLSIPARAEWLRALWLECERVINHIGDLGSLCNDVGWAYGFAQLWALKESTLRVHQQVAGERYLRDLICLGGVAKIGNQNRLVPLDQQAIHLARELTLIETRLREQAGVQDRWLTTGRVTAPLAARFGMAGLAGRASAQAWDWRVTCPTEPYRQAGLQMATATEGDVAARVAVRFAELQESLRLIRFFIAHLPEETECQTGEAQPRAGRALGWVEGWRGELMVALEMNAQGEIERWHPEEISMSQWPVVEQAVLGNIVPDFPLINKSFNLSYSGQDG